jgi:acetyltransferase-like isoleucine patch superfamily enzyme
MTFKHLGDNVTIHEPCIILKPEMIDIGDGARVDGFCKLEGGQGVTIGRWVHIASFAHVNIGGGRVIIGDGVAIASGARILAGSNVKAGHFMSCAAPADQQVIERSFVTIDEQAFIGSGATVMMGVHVGQGAIVGAGAVVTKDVPAWEIWAGVPAHKIGDRVKV